MYPFSVSELPAQILERILSSLPPTDILKMKEVSHLFLDLIYSSHYLQHYIDLFSAGLVDNPRVVCSLAKRRARLREYVDGWENTRTPVQYDFTLKSRLVGLLDSLPASQSVLADSGDRKAISFIRIASSPGQEIVKEWVLELPFRSLRYALWSQGNLLAVVERGIGFFNIHLLSLLDGSPHEIPLKSVLPLDLGHYRNPVVIEMQISGSRIALVIQVSSFTLARTRRGLIVWDWKTGELVLEHSSDDPDIGDTIEKIAATYFLEDSWLVVLSHESPVARLLVFNTLLPQHDLRSWRILDLPSPGRHGYSISTQYEKPLTELPEFSVDADQRFFAVFSPQGPAFVIPVELLIQYMHSVRINSHVPWDEWGEDVITVNVHPDTRQLQLFDTKVLALRFVPFPEYLGVEMFDLSRSSQRDIRVQQDNEGVGRRCKRILSTPKWLFRCRPGDGKPFVTRLVGDNLVCVFRLPSPSGGVYSLRIRKLGQT